MEITINAVTANRRFLKAKYRNPTLSTCLLSSVRDIDSSSETFDVLQVLFVDRPPSHRKINPPRKDRICQIEVGIPEGLDFKPAQDGAFVRALAAQVQAGIDAVDLPLELKTKLKDCVRRCLESAAPQGT